MPINWTETGRRVTMVRREARLTQGAFSAQFGLSTRALSDLEHGRIRRPSTKLLDTVHRILGYPPPEQVRTDQTSAPLATPLSRAEIRQIHQTLTRLVQIGPPSLVRGMAQVLTSVLATAMEQYAAIQLDHAHRLQAEQQGQFLEGQEENEAS